MLRDKRETEKEAQSISRGSAVNVQTLIPILLVYAHLTVSVIPECPPTVQ